MSQATYDVIAALMVELFELEPDEISPAATLFEDLDLDSLDAIDMLKHLEARTGQRISQDALRSLRTVADVVALVERLGPPA